MWTSKGYRRSRKRYEGLGHGRYLTFSCFRNQCFLRSERACRWLVESIRCAKDKYPFDLWAWVLMPHHVYLLVRPPSDCEMGTILRAAKEPVSKRASAWVRKHAPKFLPRMLDIQPNGRRSIRFWQPGGGYDRNIVSAQELREKIDYIHRNPVRAGLVSDPADWKWSSFAAWQYGRDEPLPIDRETLPALNG